MAVSGTMKVSIATMLAGSGDIGIQRGNDNWGANWLYNPDGAQNDILTIAESFANFSTSGAYATDAEVAAASGAAVDTASGLADTAVLAVSGAITNSGAFTNPTVTGDIDLGSSGVSNLGSAANPIVASGIFMQAADSTAVMQLYILANGLVSGVAA